MMVTFGTEHADPLDPLNALRAAICCQETLERSAGRPDVLQDGGRHPLRPRLSGAIHRRRGQVQTTVIGRNVNLAGGLARRPKSRWRKTRSTDHASGAASASGLQVLVDKAGASFNEGIAISRDVLVQLENHLPLVTTGGAHRVLRRADPPPNRDPICRRREVQGRAVEPPRVRRSVPSGRVGDPARGEAVHALEE